MEAEPDARSDRTEDRAGGGGERDLLMPAVLITVLFLLLGGGGLVFLWLKGQAVAQQERATEMLKAAQDAEKKAERARLEVSPAERQQQAVNRASMASDSIPPTPEYAPAATALERLIQHELEDKQLPALSIALVDDQTIVWAAGFGFADPKTPATAKTVYRVGSVSKLITDIAAMRLVEEGILDLDAPVTRYLPDFTPKNPFGKEITLRHLMSHRSGLVREPPVGHYFDSSEPGLAATVKSLNTTELVYAPESKTKYSNAAIAVVGCVLERTQRVPFARLLKLRMPYVFWMERSGFGLSAELKKDLAVGHMWTYDGRAFEAPTFELGTVPAGNLYSTCTDPGRFLSALFAARSNSGMLSTATLEQMYKPQFAKPEDETKYGLGFAIGELEGRRRIGHGGAVYGFATELAALPDDKLGVVVITSVDCANAITKRIANEALKQMLAVRQGKPLPRIDEPRPILADYARRIAGRYGQGDKAVDLIERTGRLYYLPAKGGFRAELRQLADQLVTDDRLDYGQKMRVDGDQLLIGKEKLGRVAERKPEPCPARWLGLLGEYGWDHNVLYILEKDGRLHALIEWFFLYPLKEISENVFEFPDHGLYHGEKLLFARDPAGRATQVVAASVLFNRRSIPGEDAATFTIQPLRPIDELRKEALAAKPPEEKGDFRKPELVDVTTLDHSIKLDIRYATTNNFLSTPLYTSARAFLQRPAAEALVRVNQKLAERGYGLLIHDGYRPWYVTKMFWEATPEKDRIFVADPAKGSRHNRGCAVDLTLYDRKTGQPVPMVGGFDEMSPRSYPDYPGGTSRQRRHRDLLRRAMEAEGFTVYEAEWWHFDYHDWRRYPILNVTFEQIR